MRWWRNWSLHPFPGLTCQARHAPSSKSRHDSVLRRCVPGGRQGCRLIVLRSPKSDVYTENALGPSTLMLYNLSSIAFRSRMSELRPSNDAIHIQIFAPTAVYRRVRNAAFELYQQLRLPDEFVVELVEDESGPVNGGRHTDQLRSPTRPCLRRPRKTEVARINIPYSLGSDREFLQRCTLRTALRERSRSQVLASQHVRIKPAELKVRARPFIPVIWIPAVSAMATKGLRPESGY